MSSEHIFFYAWASLNSVGPRRIEELKNYYGSFERAWNEEKPSSLDPKKIFNKITKENPKTISPLDSLYPQLLKESYPESILAYTGNLEVTKFTCLSIVGSRKTSSYYIKALETIFKDLKGLPLCIVSGLAKGIDSTAHRLALENNLPTIAVLGSPLSNVYPKENLELAKKIAKDGLILTPFLKGQAIKKENFPRRNQTVAGLSKATLVISAGSSSGANITAKLALEYNREVLVLPGNIDQELSIGTNQLLKQGAYPVTSGKDIIEILQNLPN